MRLYRLHLICVLLVSSLQAASAPATKKVETSPLAFATAFIDQLAATEDVRAAGEREMVAATSDKGKIVTMIHMSAAMELELGSEVLALRQMYLSGPFGFLPGSLAEL